MYNAADALSIVKEKQSSHPATSILLKYMERFTKPFRLTQSFRSHGKIFNNSVVRSWSLLASVSSDLFARVTLSWQQASDSLIRLLRSCLGWLEIRR